MKTNSASPTWCSDEKALLGENPLWDPADQSLSWIDVADPAVFRRERGQVTRFPMPRPVASIYLAATAGRLVVAMRRTLAELDVCTGALTPLGTLEPPSAQERFNDGRCDHEGRMWISTMDAKLTHEVGSLVRIDPDGRATSFPTRAKVGNGVCFSPDQRWLYFSDYANRAIYRFPLGAGVDMVAGRELFVTLDDAPGRPDGCTVDAEGCLWSARVGGGRIDRYSPSGEAIGALEVPVSHPTHCTFGGPDLRTLYVTSSRYPAHAPQFASQPLAGCVLAFDVDAQGLPESRIARQALA